MFWSGIQTQQENHPRKRQMNKHYSLVKILKKEVIIESVEENVQEESSAQKLEEPVCEQQRDIYEGN